MIGPVSAHSRARGNPAASASLALRLAPIAGALAGVFLILCLAVAAPFQSAADPVTTPVKIDTSGGYARLIFTIGTEIDASVNVTGNVMIISFTKPVDVSAERLAQQTAGYISAARLDPDGKAVRMAFARKLTVHSTPADDKFFVDLLPDNWSGAPPGLPPEVIEELARRAREAERLERAAQKNAQAQHTIERVRVRFARQPTFARYVFDVPAETAVSADRGKDRLTLSFGAPYKFDLGDAIAALPAAIGGITSETEEDSTLVRFGFLAKVDVRAFRDGATYVVDVVGADNKPAESGAVENGPQDASMQPPADKAMGQGAAPKVAELPALAADTAIKPPALAAPEPPPNSAPPLKAAAGVEAKSTDLNEAAQKLAAAASAAAQTIAPAAAPGAEAKPAAPPAQKREAQKSPAAAAPPVPPPSMPMAAAEAPAPKAEPHPAAPPAAMTAPAPEAVPPAAVPPPAPQPPPAKIGSAPQEEMKKAEPPAASAKVPAGTPESVSQPAAPPSAKTAAAPKEEMKKAEPSAAPTTAATPAPEIAPPPAVPPAAKMAAAPEEATNKEEPAAASAKIPAAAPERAEAAPSAKMSGDAPSANKVIVDMSRQGADLKLSFPFATATPLAVFQRADMLWIVFDSKAEIDLSALEGEASRTIHSAAVTRAPDSDIVRIRLDRPHLSSVAMDGPTWTVTIGDTIANPTHALDISRNLIGPNRSSVMIAFDQPRALHRIDDPEVGDQLLVVTALGPARGFINGQDFVEFRALASAQGVVVEPLADDINVELTPDKVVVSRPGGLAISSSLRTVLNRSGLRPLMFESRLWGLNREATFTERVGELVAVAASAPPNKKLGPRLDLARFYIAREMYPEAKGVIDAALNEQRPVAEDVSATVLRAIAEVMMNRPDDALKDLANPAIGDQHDAPIWRALAHARQGKWAQAREGFKSVEAAIGSLPVELQRVALRDEMRAAIEVGDFAGAANELNDFETIGVPHEMQPGLAVLSGRLSEGLGHAEDALTAYRAAADSWDRQAGAQGRLREVALRYSLGEIKRGEIISELESLTTIWRGDETEVEALKILARLYTEEGRYRDSFYVMRSAMSAHPDWDMTRRIQEEAGKTFEALFLDGKGDGMAAIDALALFYDFRDLTPIGRRGDEMIRRLADRLASVDLLDQAADLLQYQVDHRLQGAARAQVSTRLAVIYLMNRKADRALATLKATRTAEVATELRNQRLLLEARALSDLGRHDLALEVTSHIEGREAIRLRADILWTARRWSKSAEQLELLYGERWKDWQPLNPIERADILRGAIGYALGDDTLGLGRFREKYAAKMAKTPDARAFEIVTAQLGTSGSEFRAIAHAAASIDTLDGFLRDMQARYPETGPSTGGPTPPSAATTPAQLPNTATPSPAAETPPPPAPPARASGRTAQR